MVSNEQKKKHPHAVALGRRGGLKGGPARAAKMTPEERSESARHAVKARWAKYYGQKRDEVEQPSPVIVSAPPIAPQPVSPFRRVMNWLTR